MQGSSKFLRFLAAMLCAAGVLAARASEGRDGGAPGAAMRHQAAPGDIKHLEPRPDSVGPQPERFSWTKVDTADSYTLRIWNEADVRVVSETGLTVTTIDFPKDIDMPAGTYFWSIVGMRGDQAVAESGLAAFVVQKP
jgi:hypothetical protein